MKYQPLIVLALALAACATPVTGADAAGAQTAPAAAPPPPCEDAAYHQFDFWVGNWDVYDTGGNLAGTNSIQPEEYGCLLVERWVNTSGITGQSYNFYDPVAGEWRQLWVSGGAVIDYSGGLTPSGSMLLTGEIHNRRAGTSAPFTGEWTLNDDGSVTQHFRQQDTETGEWSDWFVGKYVRQAAE
ncbi:MAG: hypothetical protein R3B98_09805 [Hyphomonas sp.]